MSDVWEKTRKVKFDVVLEPETTFYPISKNLSDKLQSEAHKQRVASLTLSTFYERPVTSLPDD